MSVNNTAAIISLICYFQMQYDLMHAQNTVCMKCEEMYCVKFCLSTTRIAELSCQLEKNCCGITIVRQTAPVTHTYPF